MIGYDLGFQFFYLPFLGVLFDSKRQGLHDKMADTQVIRVRAGLANWASSAPASTPATAEPQRSRTLLLVLIGLALVVVITVVALTTVPLGF